MKLRALAAGAMLGGLVGASYIAMASDTPGQIERDETFQGLAILGDVLAKVQTDYVSDVDDAALVEAAMQGMLQSLDPHSSYLNQEAFEELRESTRGEYGGLGIEVTAENGIVKVVSPIDGTPGAEAGLRSGDYLTKIDGEPIRGMNLDDAVNRLRGPAGASVTITVVREGQDPFDVTIVREIIRPEVVAWRVEDDTVGYVRVAAFNERATEGVEKALQALEAELGDSMEGLLLDVRDNPGGMLEQAVDVAGLFLDGGEVVSTRGRDPREIERYNARPGDRLDGKPIVVLINEGSASAAEIVAGALQDRQRGTLVGVTTFGKGSVQSILPLTRGRDMGALRLTTATYFTPANRSIQATGIEPDIEVASRRGQIVGARMSEADLPNALGNATDGERVDDHRAADEPPEDFPEDQDYQLLRAMDVLRTVEMSEGNDRRAG